MIDLTKLCFINLKHFKILLSVLCFILLLCFVLLNVSKPQKKGYFIFVQFSNAYGIKEGTTVNYQGVKVGTVTRINIHLNKVVVLLYIKSSHLLIPCKSIFEVNQIGLFNDIAIDITPVYSKHVPIKKTFSHGLKYFEDARFIKPLSYIRGYKGISYDDLIRSTTRIAQRFDDPRFFSLFYVLLKNGVYISDEILSLTISSSTTLNLIIKPTILQIFPYLF
uniref:Mce/MlaD domain-containing protein n=1 Tax=Tolypiocladia glomerulata TaxID=860646 RepID=A0A1Z1MUB8_9FLOR|nr:hypothetical protein [Tolypiocladia glomerulata]ARW69697.1 hypothetical protein [Tolypiocladia glomerulata]